MGIRAVVMDAGGKVVFDMTGKQMRAQMQMDMREFMPLHLPEKTGWTIHFHHVKKKGKGGGRG